MEDRSTCGQIRQMFRESAAINGCKSIKGTANTGILRICLCLEVVMKIRGLDADVLLIARAEDHPDCIDNRSLTRIILTDQCSNSAVQMKNKSLIALAELAKISDFQLR